MARTTEHRPGEQRASEAAHVDLEAEHDPEVARKASLAGLRKIQQKANGGERGDVHAAAARGVSSPSTALPHADKIQAAFGDHDISHIKAHVGGSTASEMGASAYAAGDHVVFDRAPDLHTAAHEAAHVVQQAKGVNLYGGVGEAGDEYERHADAVADRVVAGESAADLLGAPSGGASAGGAVQLDTGSARVKKENDKLAGSTDTERKDAHDKANVASAQAMGSTIVRVASRLMGFVALYDQKKEEKPTDEAGYARITDAVGSEAKGCNSDLEALALYLGGFETHMSGDPDKDNRINGDHRIWADKMYQLKYAWIRYRIAFFQARSFVNKHQGIWEARDIDDAPFPDTIGGMFRSFGMKLDDARADKVEAKTEEHDLGEAMDSNIEAARLAAHALRMQATQGSAADRKLDTSHLLLHIGEVLRELGLATTKQLKAHKKDLKALAAEIDALESALEAQPDLKKRLFGSSSGLPYQLSKIRTAGGG